MQNNAKKILTILITLILVITVSYYAYFRARDFLRGPIVMITFPKDGSMLAGSLTEVSGVSQNISSLSLNGRKIFTDINGRWNEKLLLSPGYNIIEVDAKDRFGREIKKTLQVVINDSKSS